LGFFLGNQYRKHFVHNRGLDHKLSGATLYHICSLPNLDLFSLARQRGLTTDPFWEFEGACSSGDLFFIQTLIDNKKGSIYWNQCFKGACHSKKHRETIEFLIEEFNIREGLKKRNIYDRCTVFWSSALYAVCHTGDLESVELIANLKGRKNWNYGLRGACHGGHYHVVEFTIQKGASSFDGGLRTASRGGHLDLVKLMIDLGAIDLDQALLQACRGGHPQVAEFLVHKGASDLNMALSFSCLDKQTQMVALMIQMGATICNNCFQPLEKHLI